MTSQNATLKNILKHFNQYLNVVVLLVLCKLLPPNHLTPIDSPSYFNSQVRRCACVSAFIGRWRTQAWHCYHT